MNRLSFPWLALGLGLLVGAVLLVAGAFPPAGAYRLPLLTLLIVTEFGFFVTAIGAGIGINTLLGKRMDRVLLGIVIVDGLLAAAFLYLGIHLWPGGLPF